MPLLRKAIKGLFFEREKGKERKRAFKQALFILGRPENLAFRKVGWQYKLSVIFQEANATNTKTSKALRMTFIPNCDKNSICRCEIISSFRAGKL